MSLLDLIEPVEILKPKIVNVRKQEAISKVLVFYKDGKECAHQSIGLKSQLSLVDDATYSKVEVYEWPKYWELFRNEKFELGK